MMVRCLALNNEAGRGEQVTVLQVMSHMTIPKLWVLGFKQFSMPFSPRDLPTCLYIFWFPTKISLVFFQLAFVFKGK